MLNISLIFEYDAFILKLACIVIGLAYAFILYFKFFHFKESPGWVKTIMAVFRFFTISILALLLLNPLIKLLISEFQKPVIIFAQDNSESILISENGSSSLDSSYYLTQYPSALGSFLEKLENDFVVKKYSFGREVKEGVDFTYSQKQTNLSLFFEEVNTKYDNRNLGAIIVATDGLYNQGTNPVYASSKFRTPIYTVALGDTNTKKDLILSKVNYNKLVYLGNQFPIEVIVDAYKFKGRKTNLTVLKDGNSLYTQTLNINSDAFNIKVPVIQEAKTKGMQRYSIVLSELEEEISTKNNYKDIFIDVLDNRHKILILANSPHPDLATLKYAIESNQNYDVKIEMIKNAVISNNKFLPDLNYYNLVVLHQLPSKTHAVSDIISRLNEKKIPAWYILGAQTSIPVINSIRTGVSILNNRNNFNEAQAYIAENFTLFTLDSDTKSKINLFPPLLVPFGNYQNSLNECLLYQKIGMVETPYPLVVFTEDADRKSAILTGEGLWKWRLFEYASYNEHEAVNELIIKVVQFLVAKTDKRYFRIVSDKNIFLENEPVQFDAELYNKSYELVNDPEISINIIDDEGKVFPFTFSKTGKSYTLNAGTFKPGKYKYEANVKIGNEPYKVNGEFQVSELQEEILQTKANHQLLYVLASQHDGEMVYPDQLNVLGDNIRNRKDLKTIAYYNKQLSEVIHFPEVLVFLLILISAEWFLRKREGRV